jgi:hypothetical protein
MKPIIVKNSRVPGWLSWFIKVRAITLFPFIFIRDEGDEVLIRHETIHIKQQLELLIVGFYVWYLVDYLYRLIKIRNPAWAYYKIIFEQEAYANERDENYLSNRKLWGFLRSEK